MDCLIATVKRGTPNPGAGLSRGCCHLMLRDYQRVPESFLGDLRRDPSIWGMQRKAYAHIALPLSAEGWLIDHMVSASGEKVAIPELPGRMMDKHSCAAWFDEKEWEKVFGHNRAELLNGQTMEVLDGQKLLDKIGGSKLVHKMAEDLPTTERLMATDSAHIAGGSYTVGGGGSYASWSAVFADIAATLTSALTLTQHGNITETGGPTWSGPNMNGNNFTCTSDSPHYGNPASGWLITMGNVTPFVLYNSGGGAGTTEVKNLSAKKTAGTAEGNYNFAILTLCTNLKVHDMLCDGNGFSGGITCVHYAAGTAKYWNIIAWDDLTANVVDGPTFGAGNAAITWYLENSTFINNTTTCGFNCDSYAANTGYVKNCVALVNKNGYDIIPNTHGGSPSFTNCCTLDNTGTVNNRGLLIASEFESTADSGATFVKPARGCRLRENGVAAALSENTVDITNTAWRTDTYWAGAKMGDLPVPLEGWTT
jgi:hypothetical protein